MWLQRAVTQEIKAQNTFIVKSVIYEYGSQSWK